MAEFLCDECKNTGSVDCDCSGDQCDCYYGDKPCTKCVGEYDDDGDFYPVVAGAGDTTIGSR